MQTKLRASMERTAANLVFWYVRVECPDGSVNYLGRTPRSNIAFLTSYMWTYSTRREARDTIRMFNTTSLRYQLVGGLH